MLDYNGLDQRDCVPRSIPAVTTVKIFFPAFFFRKRHGAQPVGDSQPVSAHLDTIVFVDRRGLQNWRSPIAISVTSFLTRVRFRL
jgi:hypothetical protein